MKTLWEHQVIHLAHSANLRSTWKNLGRASLIQRGLRTLFRKIFKPRKTTDGVVLIEKRALF